MSSLPSEIVVHIEDPLPPVVVEVAEVGLVGPAGPTGSGGGGGGAVDSVNGETGTVVLDAADVGAKASTYVPAWSEVTGKPTFAAVAASGDYADLTGKPSIPSIAGLATTAQVATDIATASTADRARSNHTGTQTSASITDLTEAVQDIVGAMLAAGTGATVTYDDSAGTVTITGVGDPETMRDTIGAALVGVGSIGVAINDVADTITISTTATANATDAALRDRATHTGTQAASTVTGLAAVATSGAKADVGLGNVDNTSDAAKPVSTATQAALDVKAPLNPKHIVNPAAVSIVTIPGCAVAGAVSTIALTANVDYYFPFAVDESVTFDQLVTEVTTAGTGGSTARLGLFNADTSYQPTTLIEDFGTVAIDSTGVRTKAPAATTRTLTAGRYLLAVNVSAGVTMRMIPCAPPMLLVTAAMGATPLPANFAVSRTNAAFPTPGTAWNSVAGGGGGFRYVVFLRVTA